MADTNEGTAPRKTRTAPAAPAAPDDAKVKEAFDKGKAEGIAEGTKEAEARIADLKKELAAAQSKKPQAGADKKALLELAAKLQKEVTYQRRNSPASADHHLLIQETEQTIAELRRLAE